MSVPPMGSSIDDVTGGNLGAEARIVRRILLLRCLELLNGVGLLAQGLLVAAFQLLELAVDARKLARDGLERLCELGR